MTKAAVFALLSMGGILRLPRLGFTKPRGDAYGDWQERDYSNAFWGGDLGLLDHKNGID